MARRGVQVLFVVGVLIIALLLLGHSRGGGKLVVLVALALAAAGVGVGLGVAGLSTVGVVRSERGRPGPSVAGVFPRVTASFFVLLGLTPAVLAGWLLLVD